MPSLKDFHIVDLRRSVFDRDKAQVDKGKYYFSDKVYLKNSDYDDVKIRPDHVLTWVRYDKVNDFIEMKMWESQFSAEAVKAGDMLYWPEPLSPKADGSYVWQDAILMQVPLDIWLQKRKEDVERSLAEARRNREEFKETVKAASVAAGEMPGDPLLEMEDDVIRKIGI